MRRFVELIRNKTGDVLWAIEVYNIREAYCKVNDRKIFVQVINDQIENTYIPGQDLVELFAD